MPIYLPTYLSGVTMLASSLHLLFDTYLHHLPYYPFIYLP